MNFFTWITLATGAMQAATNIIPLVEKQGNGEEKRKLVIGATNAIVNSALVATGGGSLNANGNAILDQLTGSITDITVGFLNNIGQFTNTPKIPVTPVQPTLPSNVVDFQKP